MNTTVSHLFRQLRQIAAERPDCIKAELIDEAEKKALEKSVGARIEGPALMEVWKLVKLRIKPPKKLMPRIMAELKHWKCKDIKVTVSNHYSTDFTAKETDDYPPYCFAYNIECTRHVGGKCFFRVMVVGVFSDILDVLMNDRFNVVDYRLVYGTRDVNGTEIPDVQYNCHMEDQSLVREDICDALWKYHEGILCVANENDEHAIISDFVRREYCTTPIESLNPYASFFISHVKDYVKSHTLLDKYTPTPSVIRKVVYDMRRSKTEKPLKTAMELEDSPVIIHNSLDPEVKLFDPKGNFVGIIKNITALYDVKLQIKKLGIRGYYMYYGDQRINVDQNGEFDVYPQGFYDAFTDSAAELI